MAGGVVLTRDQVRALDRLAIDAYGVPGLVLMENAGRAVADVARDAGPVVRSVAVLCGGGNNGGDGYVAARHLHNAGCAVAVYATTAPAQLGGDAAVNANIVHHMGLAPRVLATEDDVCDAAAEWAKADVIVDALLGTGFAGAVRQPVASVIEACNRTQGPAVVAVDLPSGLDCDTGQPGQPTIRADVTVTLVAPKAGFDNPDAAVWLGRVVVGDIGAPTALLGRILDNGKKVKKRT